MIDIHVHLLPGIDDGPSSWEESLELAGQMADEGIEAAVCTSHVLENLDTATELIYTHKFKALCDRIGSAGIDLRLWLASELYCFAHIRTESPLATFNHNGKYMLFEFPMGEIPQDAGELIFQWTMNGIVPILAHPERNRRINHDPDLIQLMVERGVLMQMDAGSLLGEFGRSARKTALQMVDNRLVHFVASDYHRPSDKGNRSMRTAYELIGQKCERSYADLLFKHFPASAIEGKEIRPPNPVPMKRKRTTPYHAIFEGR